MTRLIKKNISFEWFSKCQIVFDVLKKIFISNIIFRHYDSNFKIVMKIDISNYVFKNVLSQYDKEKIFHFVIYFSKKHFSIECNYEIYDKKLLIIVRAFEKWRSKLKNSIHLVDVIIDHKNLKNYASIKKLNRRQIRWSEFFFEFNFRIIYRSKTIDDKLNVLTRRSNDFFKKKNILNSRHQFQHQTMLKFHVWNFKLVKLQCKIVILNFIQLHLNSIQSKSSIILIFMNINFEKFQFDDSKSQLN